MKEMIKLFEEQVELLRTENKLLGELKDLMEIEKLKGAEIKTSH